MQHAKTRHVLVCGAAAILLCTNLFELFSVAPIGRSFRTSSGKASIYDQSIIFQHIADFGVYQRQQRVDRLQGLGKSRLHSLPLITGDGFRALADEFLDDASSISISRCEKLGSDSHLRQLEAFILYVDVHIHEQFFEACLPHIRKPVVLVTHNGDPPVPAASIEAALNQPTLVHWFGQNTRIKHPKLTPIPIGLENRYNGPPNPQGYHGSLPEVIMGVMVSSAHAVSAVDVLTSSRPHTWAHFDVTTNPVERGALLHLISRLQDQHELGWIQRGGARVGPLELYREMLRFAAIVCPHGNGLDTHRAWEALYLGRIPIVLNDSLNDQWLHLPVVQLNDWNELLDEQRVVHAVQDVSGDSNLITEKLFLPWWMCRIGTAAHRADEFCSRAALLEVLRRSGSGEIL